MLISSTLKTSISWLVSIFNWVMFTWYSTKQKKFTLWNNRGFIFQRKAYCSSWEYQSGLMTATRNLQFLFLHILFDDFNHIHGHLLVLPSLRMQLQTFNCFTVNLHIQHQPMLAAFLLLILSNDMISPRKT